MHTHILHMRAPSGARFKITIQAAGLEAARKVGKFMAGKRNAVLVSIEQPLYGRKDVA